MKNQYVADAGDYGKFGILRYLDRNGIGIAVNWYLTQNDGSNDGKHVTYLDKRSEREKDPELFDCLKRIIELNTRNVLALESSNLLCDATYYHAVLDVSDCKTPLEKQQKRASWHKNALDACADKELVFLDPDNGVKKTTTKDLIGAVKYAFTTEVADYFIRGQNVMYYCSKARRTGEVWTEYKHLMHTLVSRARLLAITFHGGAQRSYIFVLHDNDYDKYLRIIKAFLETSWKNGSNSFTFEEM